MVGVNERYVSDAETIKNESPEIFEQVKSSEKTLPQSEQEVKREGGRKKVQRIAGLRAPIETLNGKIINANECIR